MHKYIYILLISTVLFSKELITPIPLNITVNIEKAKLGERLFNDTRLSKDNTISCASCHILKEGGDDNLVVSIGINGQKGTRNAPTVLNSRFNANQFWDGRAKDLDKQAEGPIHNPIEMGSNFKEVISKLKKDKKYISQFTALYADGITGNNITDAIAEFENTLITPDAKFDKFLRGDEQSLSSEEKEGYQLFKEYGCISCHNGINIGGNLMQKIGVMEDFKTKDFGKYNVTKNEDDRFYFKVPSLRNIQNTAPYFHDGQIKSLKEAVNEMAYYQVGYKLKQSETEKLVLFLKTLTGKKLVLKDKNNEK